MNWLRRHPHATKQETFNEMVRLCLDAPTPRAGYFLRDRQLIPGRSNDQCADTYRRWIEAECEVAKLVIDRDITVRNMFHEPLDASDLYGRSLSTEAWNAFVDTTTGMGVFLVGERHAIAGDQLQEALYDVLPKSQGLLARTPYSFENDALMRQHMRRSPFYAENKVENVWSRATLVPGIAMDGSEAQIEHKVTFALYRARVGEVRTVPTSSSSLGSSSNSSSAMCLDDED
jgi:hypothetical protein